jgi:hypothetical protein
LLLEQGLVPLSLLHQLDTAVGHQQHRQSGEGEAWGGGDRIIRKEGKPFATFCFGAMCGPQIKQITIMFSGNVQGSFTEQTKVENSLWVLFCVGFMYISQGLKVLGLNPNVCSWLTQTSTLHLNDVNASE